MDKAQLKPGPLLFVTSGKVNLFSYANLKIIGISTVTTDQDERSALMLTC